MIIFYYFLCLYLFLTQAVPLKQRRGSALSLLWFILSTSRDGGSTGIVVIWLPSRSSFFRRVKFYMTHGRGGEGQRLNGPEEMRTDKLDAALQIHNSTSGAAKQSTITADRNTPNERISNLCIPSMSSIMRYFERGLSARLPSQSLCGRRVSSKSSGLDRFAIFLQASPSVLCHYRDESKKKKKKSRRNLPLKIISSHILPNHWRLPFSDRSLQPVVRDG